MNGLRKMTDKELREYFERMLWEKKKLEKEVYEAEVEMIKRDIDFPRPKGVL